jgi:hypothetical protein
MRANTHTQHVQDKVFYYIDICFVYLIHSRNVTNNEELWADETVYEMQGFLSLIIIYIRIPAWCNKSDSRFAEQLHVWRRYGVTEQTWTLVKQRHSTLKWQQQDMENLPCWRKEYSTVICHFYFAWNIQIDTQ